MPKCASFQSHLHEISGKGKICLVNTYVCTFFAFELTSCIMAADVNLIGLLKKTKKKQLQTSAKRGPCSLQSSVHTYMHT